LTVAERSLFNVTARIGRSDYMKAFVMACAAAVVIAIVGVVVLNTIPDSAERAFSSSTGVRLGA